MKTGAILKETLVSFKQGSKLPLKGGLIPSSASLKRWAKKGLKRALGEDGEPVTLEYCYVGGRLHTSKEAFLRWLKRTNRIQDDE